MGKHLTTSLSFLTAEPKKKPSRFFMEQWHLARAQSPPDSPSSPSDTLRQVVTSCLEGTECGGTNTLHLHMVFLEAALSLNSTNPSTRK